MASKRRSLMCNHLHQSVPDHACFASRHNWVLHASTCRGILTTAIYRWPFLSKADGASINAEGEKPSFSGQCLGVDSSGAMMPGFQKHNTRYTYNAFGWHIYMMFQSVWSSCAPQRHPAITFSWWPCWVREKQMLLLNYTQNRAVVVLQDVCWSILLLVAYVLRSLLL